LKTEDITTIQKLLMSWYLKHHRKLPWRETINPYHIWVSEVMLQQTQVKTVIPYYKKFLASFPDIQSLANTDIQLVLKRWEGLGYYARARNLHRAAMIVLNDHNGIIPEKYADFRKLPGVGDYIAAAVLSFAFGCPHPVVDGNVKRVLARLCLISQPTNKPASYPIFKTIAGKLLDMKNPGNFNQAVMELGALICKPKNPNCDTCPLQRFCMASQAGSVEEYPKRIKSKPIPQHHIAVGIVLKNDKILITRRKIDGLLGGLWEFPGGEVKPYETPEAACIREIKEEVNLEVGIDSFVKRIKHAYTHFKIVMDVFICCFVSGRIHLSGPEDFKWIKISEMDRFPFPKSNHKIFPHLLKSINEANRK